MTVSIGTRWSDVDHRITDDSEGNIRIAKNAQAVMSSIYNILLTSQGERVFLPSFGFGLNERLVGESMNSAELDFIAEEAKRTIEAWDDRPEIIEANFFKYPDQNQVYFELIFRIRGFDQTYEYQIPIQGGAE